MPVKYVNEKTGEFIPEMLAKTGAPSAYGITTAAQLVSTSLSQSGNALSSDIYFRASKGKSKSAASRSRATAVPKKAPKKIAKAAKKAPAKKSAAVKSRNSRGRK